MQLVLAYAVFSLGYIVRPFGGLVFGHLGDVLGRRAGLLASMVCMGIPLLLISLLPTYRTIGISAAFLLIFCRLLQGLSVGGEFPSAITFLSEHASFKYRGLISSLAFVGINFGLLLASGVGAFLSHVLNPNQINLWGWRLAFFVGALLAILGYWIRRKISETPVFLDHKNSGPIHKFPLAHSLKQEWLKIIQAIGTVAVFASASPVILIFMPTYLSHYLDRPMTESLVINSINILVFIILIPIAAYLSDLWGRKILLLAGSLGFLIFSEFFYGLIQSQNHYFMWTGLIGLALCTALITGPLIPALAEFFRTTSRSTSVALAYNFSVALFGGTSLVIITEILKDFGNLHAPAWVMMGTGLVSAISILTVKFHKRPSL